MLLHILINFFGSIVPIILERIGKILAEYEELVMEFYEEFQAGAQVPLDEIAFLVPLSLVSIILSVLSMGLWIAGLVVFAKNVKRVYVSDRCEILIPKEKRMGIIFKNVGVILFILICAASFILSTPLVSGLLNPEAPAPEVNPEGVFNWISYIIHR